MPASDPTSPRARDQAPARRPTGRPPAPRAEPRAPESEKLTLNLGHVDLGRVDLLVADGHYANRADFLRAAVRRQLERHDEDLRGARARRALDLGLREVTRAELEAARERGEPLRLRVLGLCRVASDVPPDLARAAIAELVVLGALHAPPAVRAALADRLG